MFMLSSDILLFEYFKKKENDWASKGENALNYLKRRSPEEITSEFKGDSSFEKVISYINSVENNISDNLSEEDLKKKIKKIYIEKDEPIVELTNKLKEAITEAKHTKDDTNNPRENIAISLAASIAIAIFLSNNELLRGSRKAKNNKYE